MVELLALSCLAVFSKSVGETMIKQNNTYLYISNGSPVAAKGF